MREKENNKKKNNSIHTHIRIHHIYRIFSGNFAAFKVVAIGASAAKLSDELVSAYEEAAEPGSKGASDKGTGGDGLRLDDAVRLAARVLDGERRRQLDTLEKASAVSAGGASGVGNKCADSRGGSFSGTLSVFLAWCSSRILIAAAAAAAAAALPL